MPEFSKLNGYDVKDKTARNMVATYGTGSFYEKLHGKTVIVLGDSLTIGSGAALGNTWVELLATKYGCTCYNYGVSGSKISNGGDSAYASDMATRITSILSNHNSCDYFILMGGANDKNQNVVIGTTNDTTTSTFIGAIKSIIYKVVSKYGNKCQVLTMTTYHRFDTTNAIGMGEYDYVQGMINASSFFSVPCFNNYNNCGITLASTGYTPEAFAWADISSVDPLVPDHHFSPAAYAYMLPKYEAFICNAFDTNESSPFKLYNDTAQNIVWIKRIANDGEVVVTADISFVNEDCSSLTYAPFALSSVLTYNIPTDFQIVYKYSENMSWAGDGYPTVFRNTVATSSFKLILGRLSASATTWTGHVYIEWRGFNNV